MSTQGPGAAETAPAVVNTWIRGADMAQGICSVDGCARPAGRRSGMCAPHRDRLSRTGKMPTGPVRVRLSGPFEERFWAKVDKGDGCWEWTGGRANRGYGHVEPVRGQNRSAHRVSWELTNGPIPDGLWVLHRCDNPPCVRPSHLFLGTHADNMRDMEAKGRGKHPVLFGPLNPAWRDKS